MSDLRSRSSLPVLFSVVIIDLIGFGIVIPILPLYAEAYGANAKVLGLLVTSFAGMQFFFAPIWGRLSDRVGRRPVMLATISGTAVALLILGLADSLFWLFVARILGGIFGANISVATAYVADITAESERTRWMGMIGASFGVGFILGPAIGGGLAPWGFHVPLLVAAGLAGLNLLFAVLVLREPAAHRERGGEPLMQRLRVPSESMLGRLWLAFFLFSLGVSQLETVFVFFMEHRFNYDARQVSYLLVMMAVIVVAVQGGGIRSLAARFGERRLVTAGSLLLAVSFSAMPWMGTVSRLLIPLSLSAVGRGVFHPSVLSLVSLSAAPDERGTVLGTFQSGASLARIVGPLLAGTLYDFDDRSPFLLAGMLLAVVLVVATRLREPSEATVSDSD